MRSKNACDSSGYAAPLSRKLVCRFFYGPRRPRLTVPPIPPSPWFPAFDLDSYLTDAYLGLLDSPAPDFEFSSVDSGEIPREVPGS